MDLRAKSIKFLKENIATNLHDLGFGNGHQKNKQQRKKIDELDSSKLKTFVHFRTILRK